MAPKTAHRRVHLCRSNGHMLSTSEEHATLLDYYANLFQSQLVVHDVGLSWPEAEVTPQKMRASLQKTEIGKAVPMDSAPSSIRRACAEDLATEAAGIAIKCLRGAQNIPARWRDCNLALLPKPNKPCRRPENLRPLGIQDVSGKCFARCLKDMLYTQVQGCILQYPQFAYIQNRSTNDAISRVIDHAGM